MNELTKYKMSNNEIKLQNSISFSTNRMEEISCIYTQSITIPYLSCLRALFVISIITWQKVFYFQKIPFRRTPIISAVHNDIFPCAFGQKVSKDILFNFIAFVVWPFFLFRLIPSTRQYMHYRPDIYSI